MASPRSVDVLRPPNRFALYVTVPSLKYAVETLEVRNYEGLTETELSEVSQLCFGSVG